MDVFDALTSKRPYKDAYSFDKAMELLRRGRGSHFDPYLLDAFDAIAPKLYSEISSADDAMVEEALRKLVTKYYLSIEDLPQR